jgi:hypothetical protein
VERIGDFVAWARMFQADRRQTIWQELGASRALKKRFGNVTLT